MNFATMLKLLSLAQELIPVFMKAWQQFQDSLRNTQGTKVAASANEPCDPEVEAAVDKLLEACKATKMTQPQQSTTNDRRNTVTQHPNQRQESDKSNDPIPTQQQNASQRSGPTGAGVPVNQDAADTTETPQENPVSPQTPQPPVSQAEANVRRNKKS